MDNQKLIEYTKAFGKFWYNFIIGEDWTLATAAVVGVVIEFYLRINHLTSWYILPLILGFMLGVSILRKH